MTIVLLFLQTVSCDTPVCGESNVGDSPFCFPKNYNKVINTEYINDNDDCDDDDIILGLDPSNARGSVSSRRHLRF